mgnify:FL=1
MVLTVYDRDSLAKAQAEVKKLEEKKQKENKAKKKALLKKMEGMFSHLNMTPMEIQEEMRDGWLE